MSGRKSPKKKPNLFMSPSAKRATKKNLKEVLIELNDMPFEKAQEKMFPLCSQLKKDDMVKLLHEAFDVYNISTLEPYELVQILKQVMSTMDPEELCKRLEINPKREKKKKEPLDATIVSALIEEVKRAKYGDFFLQKVLVHQTSQDIILLLYNNEQKRLALVTFDPYAQEISKVIMDQTKTQVEEQIKKLGQDGFKSSIALFRTIDGSS